MRSRVAELICLQHAESFKNEIDQLHRNGQTHKNATHLIKHQQRHLLEKEGIHEAELSLDSAIATACPALSAWDQSSALRTLLTVLWPPDASPIALALQATKLQFNAGAHAVQRMPASG